MIFLMLPAALALAALAAWGFIHAVRTGQFDDLDTPPLRAVFDDDEAPQGSVASPTALPTARQNGKATSS